MIEIPTKRHPRTMISYLDRPEIDALLDAPDRGTWLGRRDHAMLLTAIQTGVRVSELVNLTITSLTLATGAHLRVLSLRVFAAAGRMLEASRGGVRAAPTRLQHR